MGGAWEAVVGNWPAGLHSPMRALSYPTGQPLQIMDGTRESHRDKGPAVSGLGRKSDLSD